MTIALLLVISSLLAACGSSDEEVLTVYSGRSENLIAPLLEDFTTSTGIEVEVRYGESADLALLIDEEGDRSPADVFISQSPGAVGFLAERNILRPLDSELLDLVPRRWRNAEGMWVGVSGRVRVLVYNEDLVDESGLPDSVFELADEQYRGLIGLAPGNGSFQDFVTILRETHGDDVALEWLTAMNDNEAVAYAGNSAIVQAVGRGEIPMGLVNHYYNHRALAEDPSLPSRNHYFPSGDVGSVLIATAVGILQSSDDSELGARFVSFLLGDDAQMFLAGETFEYPLALDVEPAVELPSLAVVGSALGDLDGLGGGLERTKELIGESGLEAP